MTRLIQNTIEEDVHRSLCNRKAHDPELGQIALDVIRELLRVGFSSYDAVRAFSSHCLVSNVRHIGHAGGSTIWRNPRVNTRWMNPRRRSI